MYSVSDLKKKLQSTWWSMADQDFISRPWVIALLVITAAFFILILAPTIIQNLPDRWREIAGYREALRNQLAAGVDRLAPGLRNDLEERLDWLRQLKSNFYDPIQAIGFIIVVSLAAFGLVVNYIWPGLRQWINSSIQ
jgi:hypothetical protein